MTVRGSRTIWRVRQQAKAVHSLRNSASFAPQTECSAGSSLESGWSSMRLESPRPFVARFKTLPNAGRPKQSCATVRNCCNCSSTTSHFERRSLAASRRCLEMHSLLGREVMGHSEYEVFPELPESWKEEHRRALAGEALPADERFLERADGSAQWVRREIIPWRAADGAVGGIIIVSVDINWQKQAEAALRESQELLQLFIANAPVALAMFDREMRYLTVSHRWAKDHSITDQEIVGHSHYEINPDIPERWKETHRRGLAGERQRSEEDRYDSADGTMQWIRWEIIPWMAANGAIGGIIMSYEDIFSREL